MSASLVRRLEDTGQWVNRMEIKSETSSRLYIVAEKVIGGVPSGTWGCNCPGWKGYGNCKHLRDMGLKSCRERTRPAPRGLGAGDSAGFADSAYRHYDPRAEGYGSAEEWIRTAEAKAAGHGRYLPPRQRAGAPRVTADMRLVGLTEMPADAAGLVKAMRRQARRIHPDVVHPTDSAHRAEFPLCPACDKAAEDFTAFTDAYERLLRRYAK